MDNKKLIFWGMIAILIILGIVLVKINSLSTTLGEDCKVFYNLTNGCPCLPTKSGIDSSFLFKPINFSTLQ